MFMKSLVIVLFSLVIVPRAFAGGGGAVGDSYAIICTSDDGQSMGVNSISYTGIFSVGVPYSNEEIHYQLTNFNDWETYILQDSPKNIGSILRFTDYRHSDNSVEVGAYIKSKALVKAYSGDTVLRITIDNITGTCVLK